MFQNYSKNPAPKEILELIGQKYRTHARFEKARQHLRESGKLKGEPSDIWALVVEVQRDIFDECHEEIAAELLKWAKQKLNKAFVKGLPEWYKMLLADSQFHPGEPSNAVEEIR